MVAAHAMMLSTILCLVSMVHLSGAAVDSAKWSNFITDSPSSSQTPDVLDWCVIGQKQSPINLNVTGNKVKKAEPFNFLHYGDIPSTSYVSNTGGNVLFEIREVDAKDMPQVTGGGMEGRYNFAQLHFHWGTVHTIGSEHTVSEESYPMELHMVHFNTKYGEDFDEAMAVGNGAQDTLAVLSIMFRITEEDNQKLQPLIETLTNVKEFETEAKADPFPLIDLLPVERNTFYRYNGSLTTNPPCDEVVIWTVFKNPIDISRSQMSAFDDLTEENSDLINNFRPTQPLNGRIVYDMDTTQQTTSGGASGMSSLAAGLIAATVAAVFAAASGKS